MQDRSYPSLRTTQKETTMRQENEQEQSEPRGDASGENTEDMRAEDRGNERWWENPGPAGEVQ
jgi:hypothetical protein